MKKQLNIDELIKQLIEYQKKVTHALEYDIGEKYNDSIIIDFFANANNNLLFVNSAISKKIADYCQLLNEEKNFEKVSLEQIKEIYERLVKIHPLDIGFYESLAFYLNNVQDRPKEARQILSSGIDIIERKLSDLKKAIKDFD